MVGRRMEKVKEKHYEALKAKQIKLRQEINELDKMNTNIKAPLIKWLEEFLVDEELYK